MPDGQLAEAAAESFSLLSDPARVEILLALSTTRQYSWAQHGMRYSDLRAAVEIEDGGRFNYHLDQLRGEFVVSEDGHYWLSAAGSRTVDEVYAKTPTGTDDRREGKLTYTCVETDEPLTVTIEHGVLVVECPHHGTVFDMPLPFSVAEMETRDVDELYEYAFQQARQYCESVLLNVCPHCGGTFEEPTVEPSDDASLAGVSAGYRCQRCAVAFHLPIESMVLFRPPVVAFLSDHGLDVHSPALYSAYGDWQITADLHQDQIITTFVCGDERLTVELDRSLELVSTQRTTLADSSVSSHN